MMESSPFLPFLFTALLAICSTLAFLLIYLRSSFGWRHGNIGFGANNSTNYRPQLSIKAYHNATLSPLSQSPSPESMDDDSPPILCTVPIRSSAKSKHKKRL